MYNLFDSFKMSLHFTLANYCERCPGLIIVQRVDGTIHWIKALDNYGCIQFTLLQNKKANVYLKELQLREFCCYQKTKQNFNIIYGQNVIDMIMYLPK